MSDQRLIAEVYYHVLEERAKNIFDELSYLFKKFTNKENPQLGDEYVYELDGSTFKIVKTKDGFQWGRWWQGQLWGRFISKHSTSDVQSNKKLVDFLKRKHLLDLENEFPEIRGTL